MKVPLIPYSDYNEDMKKHISIENLSVEYNELSTHLNSNLLKRQKVSIDNTSTILAYHYYRCRMFYQIQETKSDWEEIQIDADFLFLMENSIQWLWNFEVDSLNHSYWYKIPGCTCCKRTNDRLFGKAGSINPFCKVHGEDKKWIQYYCVGLRR